MLIIGLLQWWYGDGWARQLTRARDGVAALYDYFSVDLLAKSLFSPFRQISAGSVQGSLGVQWRAFVDKAISRFIGAFMRTILIVSGVIAIALLGMAGFVAVLLWAALPLLPFAGLFLMMIGWLPWKV